MKKILMALGVGVVLGVSVQSMEASAKLVPDPSTGVMSKTCTATWDDGSTSTCYWKPNADNKNCYGGPMADRETCNNTGGTYTQNQAGTWYCRNIPISNAPC